MSTNASPATTLLLGRDHEEYGRFAVARVSEHTVCAISAGADQEFALTTQKEHTNEDAIFVFEDDRHTVICVADAHFGRESSERLIERLAQDLLPVPQNPEQLDAVFAAMAKEKATQSYASETTLTVCILDRMFRQAFGLSFGDSSVVHVAPGELPQRENERDSRFVSLAKPSSLSPERGTRLSFSPRAGDLLLVFTDGVDECCYRDPDRSIGPEQMHALIQRTGPEPESIARDLTQLALAGVDGNPGGQDNIALVVTRV